MAPRKQPKSLSSVCLQLVGGLVHETCVRIDAKYTIHETQWLEYVNALQAYLVENIPHSFWDQLYDDVMLLAKPLSERTRVNDFSVFYAVFIHSNTKRLKIEGWPSNTEDKYRFYFRFGEAMMASDELTQAYRDLWLPLIPKLVNLERFECATGGYDLIVRFFRHCSKLRHLRLYINFSWAQHHQLVTYFPTLQHIYFRHSHLAFDMEENKTFELHSPLPLLSYYQSPRNISSITTMIQLLPHLQELRLEPECKEMFSEMMKTLAESSLRLTTIEFGGHFLLDRNAANFFSVKGAMLKSIFLYSNTSNLYLSVVHIGRTCQNLTSLTVSTDQSEDIDVPLEPVEGIMFQKCTKLMCIGGRIASSLSKIAALCLSKSRIVSDFQAMTPLCRLNEDALIALFDPLWMTEMNRIEFLIPSERVLRHIYENCPKLTHLSKCRMVNGTDYLARLYEEVVKNNLDLVVRCH